MTAARPPSWLAVVLRLPTQLYAHRLGWLLGHRFLQLDHIGRRSHLIRHTVLEVVSYHDDIGEAVVISGFGAHADWFLNIQANSRMHVQISRTSFDAQHRMIEPAEAAALLAEYQSRHWIVAPLVRAVLSRLLGWHYDGSTAARRRAVTQLPMVAFRPVPSAR